MISLGMGKFRLEDTLDRFWASNVSREKTAITIRHLLSHSSGLPAYKPFYSALLKIPAPQRRTMLLRWILETPLLHPPGKAAVYSDLGYILLGILLETVWEQSLDRLLERMLRSFRSGTPWTREANGSESSAEELSPADEVAFAPLQVFPDPELPPVRMGKKRLSYAATEHCPWRRRLLEGEVHDENAYCLGGIAAHAGLFGTPRNVRTVLDFLWKARSTAPAHIPWLRDVVGEFWERQRWVPQSTWALGFDTPTPGQSSAGSRFSHLSVGHLGYTGTSFWLDPDRELLVVLLSNRVYPSRQNDKIRAFRPKLHDLAVDVYEELQRV